MTIAEISHRSRSRIAVLRKGAGSASIETSRRAPVCPSACSSSARALENEVSAASAAEKRPASTTRAAARTMITGSAPGSALSPRGKQLVLEPEHLGVLLRLGVVVAEQVQDPVHGEQLEL